MKCPKCGYIGFESSDRCRNCGYEFALAADPPAVRDLPLRPDEPIGPLVELTMGRPVTPPGDERPRAARRAPLDTGVAPASETDRPRDLPLFDSSPVRPVARVQGSAIPPPRAPLAVRRSTPPAARARSRTPRSAQVDLDLKAEVSAEVSPPGPSEDHLDVPAVPSLGRRLLAAVIDSAILGPVDLAVLYFTLRLCRLTASEIVMLPVVPLLVFFLVLDGGYLFAFTAAAGQTIGKMAVGIKVVSLTGGRVSVGRAVARTLAWFVSVVPLGVGLLPAAFDRARRSLHDRLSGTRVITVAAR